MENNVITPAQLNAMELEKCQCGCPFFREETIIKKQKGLLIGSKNDVFIPFQYLVCKGCGQPHFGIINQNSGIVDLPIFAKAINGKPNEGGKDGLKIV